MRWGNALIAAGAVLLAAWWVGGDPLARAPLATAAAAVALAAVANAYNDYRDVAIDRVAHPERPLASGALSRRTALAVVAVSAVAAILLSAVAAPMIAAASAAIVVLMLAYSRWLKRLGLVGNLVVAVTASLPFLYGGWSVGRAAAALPLVAVAVPLHLAREIAKDLDDAPGDAPERRTLPVAAGSAAARAACLAALAAFALVLALFVWRRPRLAPPLLPAVALCLVAAGRVMASRRGGPLLLKSAMLCALAALAVERAW